MMLVIFAAMLLAHCCALCGLTRLAIIALLICLALSTGLFLFEIYNPDYGFRMPWLQVELPGAFHAIPKGIPA